MIALTTPQAVAPADRVEKTNVIVKAMTKTMVEALKIPHFGYKDEVMKMIRMMMIMIIIIEMYTFLTSTKKKWVNNASAYFSENLSPQCQPILDTQYGNTIQRFCW